MNHRRIASMVADELIADPGVIGVVLAGSVAIGRADEYSDIDLYAIVTPDRQGQPGPSSMQRDGVSVELDWYTLDYIESRLAGWHDETQLYIYATADVLADPTGAVSELLDRYNRYPDGVWRQKLFDYWYYAVGHAPRDSGKALDRSDRVTAEFSFRIAAECYAGLVFLLNDRFVPYRRWRALELETLQWLPPDFLSHFETMAVSCDTTEKQDIAREFERTLEPELVAAGVPRRKLRNPFTYKTEFTPIR